MKVIFLDIDGVLQSGQKRFQHDLDALKNEKIKEDKNFEKIDKYDLGAVVYDWNSDAVKFIKLLCDKTGAKIVLSSDWRRSKNIQIMKLLMNIHLIGEYLVDYTPFEELSSNRCAEVQRYLQENPDVSNFVIIDDVDWGFTKVFPDNLVITSWLFEKEHYKKAIAILKK